MRTLRNYHRSSPVYQDPFRAFESFFNAFLDEDGKGEKRHFGKIRPAANIVEDKDGQFCIELSAPGFEKDDFNVELNDRVLTVSARKETKEETDDEGKIYHREFSSYELERSFTLGEELDPGSLNAKYENGILNIRIARKPEVAELSRKIEIQ